MKDKERIFKAWREKQLLTYKEISMSQIADFFAETLKERRQWDDVFKILRERLSIKNSRSSKTTFQKWERKQDIPR